MKKETKKSIGRLLIAGLILVGVIGVGYLVARWLGWTEMSEESLRQMIASTGAIAPLVYIFVSFIQVTFVPIPAAVTIVAGCYLFGLWQAFLYSYLGMMAGGMLAFGLGKWFGRPFVNWVSGGKEETERWIAKLKGKEKVLMFFIFLFPGFPDDILCSVAGVLPISWGCFFWMQAVTRVTSIGGTLLFLSGKIIPFSGWGLWVLGGVGVLLAVLFILCIKNAGKISEWFASVSKRNRKRMKKGP